MASPFAVRTARRSRASRSASSCPHAGRCVDDLCVIRSMVADNINHPNACLQMFTGEQVFSRPSLGSWLLYGLGSENQDLPGFVAICPSGGEAALWGSSFLPAAYQGTRVADLAHPIANLANRPMIPAASSGGSSTSSTGSTACIAATARTTAGSRRGSSRSSWPSGCRCRPRRPSTSAREPESVRRLYGLDRPHTEGFGRQCLIARRLVERGVRFVQLHTESNWDHHTRIRTGLPACCAGDRPAGRRAA